MASRSEAEQRRLALREEERQNAQHLQRNPLFKSLFVEREQALIDELAAVKVNWFTRRKRDALLMEYQTVREIRAKVDNLAQGPQARKTAPL